MQSMLASVSLPRAMRLTPSLSISVKPLALLALNSSEPPTRSLSRTSRPLSGRVDRYNSGFFIKHKRELTTLPVLRYSSRHKKGGLKILSMIHRDPFDRMLIAQALANGLTMVTDDHAFGRYKGLRVLPI